MFRRCVTMITLVSIFNALAAAPARATKAGAPASVSGDKRYCAPCSAGGQNEGPAGLDALATLGRRTQPLPFAPLVRSIYDGATVNLVSTARGHLSFYVTDLALYGVMPVLFQRYYSSDRYGEDGGLGYGWSFAFDDRITLEGDAATLKTGTGSTLVFRREAGAQRFTPEAYEPGVERSLYLSGRDSITERAGQMTRTYQRLGGLFRLARVADPNGNQINISFDGRGKIARIANGRGALALKWADGGGAAARLLSVTDGAGQTVSFRQDGQRLRAAVDQAGSELTYDYSAGRLVRVADPLGRVMLRVRYDQSGRVIQAGDAAGAYHFQYDSASGASGRTVVTDPVGIQVAYEHARSGALTGVTAGGGAQSARFEYDASNRLVRTVNSPGGEVTFSYDSQNRLVRKSSAAPLNESEASYAYDREGRLSSVTEGGLRTNYARDSRGNIVAATGDDPARGYTMSFNERGQVINARSAAGREISHEYDAAGVETAYTVSGVGRFETERDAAGRILKERFPSGLAQGYEYDARGKLARQWDSRGRTVAFERDAAGALTGIVLPGGRWVRAERDGAGRIVALTNSAGKSRRFGYDARGALVDYWDALGRRKRVGYDRQGRVREVAESSGRRTVIERDGAGNLLNVRREGAGRKRANGFVVSLFNHAPASSQLDSECFFEYDGFDQSSGWTIEEQSDFGTFGWDSFGSGCYDPFGGDGGGGCGWEGGYDSWYMDPWAGSLCSLYLRETCEQCMSRQAKICERLKNACVAELLGVLFRNSFATCALAAFATGGIAALLCAAFTFGGAGADGVACTEKHAACEMGKLDKCPQCN